MRLRSKGNTREHGSARQLQSPWPELLLKRRLEWTDGGGRRGAVGWRVAGGGREAGSGGQAASPLFDKEAGMRIVTYITKDNHSLDILELSVNSLKSGTSNHFRSERVGPNKSSL